MSSFDYFNTLKMKGLVWIGLFTIDSLETNMHMAPMNVKNKKEALEYLNRFLKDSHMVIVNPSGWTNANKPLKWLVKDKIALISISYSKHSNWDALVEFVNKIPCDYLVPTVKSTIQILKLNKEHPEQSLLEWNQRCKEREEKKQSSLYYDATD